MIAHVNFKIHRMGNTMKYSTVHTRFQPLAMSTGQGSGPGSQGTSRCNRVLH